MAAVASHIVCESPRVALQVGVNKVDRASDCNVRTSSLACFNGQANKGHTYKLRRMEIRMTATLPHQWK